MHLLFALFVPFLSWCVKVEDRTGNTVSATYKGTSAFFVLAIIAKFAIFAGTWYLGGDIQREQCQHNHAKCHWSGASSALVATSSYEYGAVARSIFARTLGECVAEIVCQRGLWKCCFSCAINFVAFIKAHLHHNLFVPYVRRMVFACWLRQPSKSNDTSNLRFLVRYSRVRIEMFGWIWI